jgi:hypothetical protein
MPNHSLIRPTTTPLLLQEQQQQQQQQVDSSPPPSTSTACHELIRSKHRCVLLYIALGGWICMIVMLAFDILSNYQIIIPYVKQISRLLNNLTVVHNDFIP